MMIDGSLSKDEIKIILRALSRQERAYKLSLKELKEVIPANGEANAALDRSIEYFENELYLTRETYKSVEYIYNTKGGSEDVL